MVATVAVLVPITVAVRVAAALIPAAMKPAVVSRLVAVPVVVPIVLSVPALMLMAVAVPISVAVPLMLPLPLAMAPIVVAVMIAIVVPSRVRAARWGWHTVPAAALPNTAPAGRHAGVRGVRRDSVVLVDVLHPTFHAADFALVVGRLVRLPARVIAVEAPLVAYREPNLLRVREMRECERGEHEQEYKPVLH